METEKWVNHSAFGVTIAPEKALTFAPENKTTDKQWKQLS